MCKNVNGTVNMFCEYRTMTLSLIGDCCTSILVKDNLV